MVFALSNHPPPPLHTHIQTSVYIRFYIIFPTLLYIVGTLPPHFLSALKRKHTHAGCLHVHCEFQGDEKKIKTAHFCKHVNLVV